MKKVIIKSTLMAVCTAGCIAGCILLYHIKDEYMNLLLSKISNAVDEDMEQNVVNQENIRNYSLNDDYTILLGEQEEKLSSVEDKLQLLQLKSNVQALVEKKETENADPYMVYEKYFRLKQGELAEIKGLQDLQTCGKFGFLNSHFGGVTFEAGNGIEVQYINDNVSQIWEYALPRTLIITKPDLNIGFMGARAGMDFAQIQASAYEAEIQEGYWYSEENTVYYITYMDEFYEYTFISYDLDGRDSLLTVEKVM